MSFHDDYMARVAQKYLEERAAGEHDLTCEVDIRGFFFCHCAKRAREARGETEPPGPLEWRYPDCPRCWNETDGDADGFSCGTCHVSWGHKETDPGTFTDDHGDLAAWKAEWLEQQLQKEAQNSVQPNA